MFVDPTLRRWALSCAAVLYHTFSVPPCCTPLERCPGSNASLLQRWAAGIFGRECDLNNPPPYSEVAYFGCGPGSS